MVWVVIRTATDGDYIKIEAAAKRFAVRHSIAKRDASHWWSAVDSFLQFDNDLPVEQISYLNRLWVKCFSRAVGHEDAVDVAWGAIGHPEKV